VRSRVTGLVLDHLSLTHPVEQCRADVFVGVLSVREREILNLKDAVVAVDEVDLVAAVDEHHVARAVGLPRHLIHLLAEVSDFVSVHGNGLRTGEARLVPVAEFLI
jgi:hypothetical protein